MKPRYVTLPVLVIGIIAISFAAIFIRLIGDVNPVVIATWRLLFAAAIILPLGLFVLRGRLFEIIKTHGTVLFLSGFFLSVHFFFWIASLAYTSVASSVVIVCTNPIWVGVASYLFLEEKPTKTVLIGIILTVVGSSIIGWGDFWISPRALFGDMLALFGAFLASGYLIVGRSVRHELSNLEYVTPVYAIAAVIAVLVSLFLRLELSGYGTRIFLLFLALAVIPQLIGHTVFNWALGVMPASLVAVAIVGEPVGSTVLAYFILAEEITPIKVVGGVATLLGIVTALYRREEAVEVGLE
jgi:drug/metabolite transporter (DMT)-like permease